MLEYPKIETLYNRDEKSFKVMPDKLRMPEFEIIKRWHVTEKIDGTNIRIMWSANDGEIIFSGRTDNSQIPSSLVRYLNSKFNPEMFINFKTDVILFGEGYGEKIQKDGGNYRTDVSVRLFDILIDDWWLEPDNVLEIARNMDIKTVPLLGSITELPQSYSDLLLIIGTLSKTAFEDNGVGLRPEGIVARSCPLLFCRNGGRVMWKLKYKDFVMEENAKKS